MNFELGALTAPSATPLFDVGQGYELRRRDFYFIATRLLFISVLLSAVEPWPSFTSLSVFQLSYKSPNAKDRSDSHAA